MAAAAIAIHNSDLQESMIICGSCAEPCGQPLSCRKVMVGQIVTVRVGSRGLRATRNQSKATADVVADRARACGLFRRDGPYVEGCGLVFAHRTRVHPKRVDRNASAQPGEGCDAG